MSKDTLILKVPWPAFSIIENTGPTKTEEDIEKSFGGYLELAKKLALDLMAKARCEIMTEVLAESLKQETAESWNKRLDSDE